MWVRTTQPAPGVEPTYIWVGEPFEGPPPPPPSMVTLGQATAPPCDYGKAQWIRVLDVFLIGPVMIWGGLGARGDHPVLGPTLALMGAGTIALNGYNFLRFGGFCSLVGELEQGAAR